jgi:hypothetical protein
MSTSRAIARNAAVMSESGNLFVIFIGTLSNKPMVAPEIGDL